MKTHTIELKDKKVQVLLPPGIKTISRMIVTLDLPSNLYQYELGEIHVRFEGSKETIEFVLDESNCETKNQFFHYSFEQVFDVSGVRSVDFRHMKIPRDYEGNCTLQFVLSEVPIIEIYDPLLKFENHLQQYDNSKIVFSAPFGEGKTTFLDYFFEQKKEEYEVFKVFPVNYSVASNEDIFKYIKTDVLFQLLGKDLVFEEVSLTIMEAFQEYIYLNPKKTVVSFLKNVSHLNSTLALISKALEGLNEFIAPILKYHEDETEGERTKAEKYVKEIYEKEGSLFEDNFYSQLIRGLLEQIQDKKTVLIIEDLDRMDPDHVFRILNVISAHYDAYNSISSNLSHNKFGFDKIIVVCDVRNIKSIFEHRYGSKVDFNGYFNKFFSTQPFDYNNKNMLMAFARKAYIPEKVFKADPSIEALIFLLEIFIQNDLISLRELIKLKGNSFADLYQEIDRTYSSNRSFFDFEKNIFSMPLFYLSKYYDRQLDLKFGYIENLNLPDNTKYDYWSKELMAGLAAGSENTCQYKHNDVTYTIQRTQYYDFRYWRIQHIKNTSATEINFTDKDFFKLLKISFNIMKKL